jgi:hypothetical protein
MHAPPSGTGQNDDRLAGWLILALSGVYLLQSLLIGGGLMAVLRFVGQEQDVAAKNTLREIIAYLLLRDLLLVAVNAVVAIGVMQSLRWAFFLGLIFNTILAVTNAAWTLVFDDWATLLTLMIAVFCFLRVSGKVGPPV